MTALSKKSEVLELNQAKLGSVNFRQSCQLNFGIVVRGIITTNLISKTLFVEKIQQIKINIENKQIFKNKNKQFLSIGMLVYNRAQQV